MRIKRELDTPERQGMLFDEYGNRPGEEPKPPPEEMAKRPVAEEAPTIVHDIDVPSWLGHTLERYPGMRQKLNAVNEDGFPEELEQLYEGFDIGDAKGTKLKYLRRLPRDPITGKAEWGTRSSRDRPGSTFWDGINVFDVYSQSDKIALDGTPYATW